MKKILRNRYLVATILILLAAFFLRFYNFEDRFVLAFDQAHNAIIARYALNEFKLPLLGPFASAGPFQTGGEWFWIVMIQTIVYPFSPITPWVVQTLLYVVFVYLMMRFARELFAESDVTEFKKLADPFSIIVGVLTAFSMAQVLQSYNLTNQTPLAPLGLFCIWAAVRYIRRKNPWYIFLAAFFASLAGTIHLSGVLLGSIVLITLIITRLHRKRDILYVLAGGVLPLMPIFVSDLQHNFFNFRNMFYYYFFDESKASYEQLGRRWLTYIGVFWPNSWAFITGGVKEVGYFLIAGIGFVVGYLIFKRKFPKEWWVLLLSFIVIILALRYTRTPIFENYLVFLHPLVILFTGLFLVVVYSKNKIIGVVCVAILVLGSLYMLWPELNKSNYNRELTENFRNALYEKYPNQNFSLYDLKRNKTEKSFPLSLYLFLDGRISEDGVRVGVLYSPEHDKIEYPVIYRSVTDDIIVDLSATSSAYLAKTQWFIINPDVLYDSMQNWQKD